MILMMMLIKDDIYDEAFRLAQERESARKEAWEAFKRKRAEILLMNALVKLTLDMGSKSVSADHSTSSQRENQNKDGV